MNEYEKALLDKQLRLKRGAAIIEGTQNELRQDGYTNMLNKYGTTQDNTTAYEYSQESYSSDLELIRLYESNGLFTKIIDRPAEEAVKHGFDIDYGNKDIAEYVDTILDKLDFEEKFATALKWSRLYGGAIIVMLVNDGKGIEEPLNIEEVTSIEELRVFERSVVQPDYTSMYRFGLMNSLKPNKPNIPFGEPEFYQISSIYGYFTVHRSRCLVFRNGKLPEQTTNALYRYWGIPEYIKIKRALRECITTHENGVKLLERSVQAIYKMKELANMLATSDGEETVLQRLQVIDMARGILNSIAIDAEEEYDFKTLPMSGVKDIIDSTCNMLSAVTNIPQTILFGRSPAGMNATGDSDLENYYNMVENIQKQNLKSNSRIIIDLILKQGKAEGKLEEIPIYKIKFVSLWSMSESEKASTEQIKASTEYTKAQTAQLYIDSNILDPSEIRKSLVERGEFDLNDTEIEDNIKLPDDVFDIVKNNKQESISNSNKPPEKLNKQDSYKNIKASAVITIKDGKILCAERRNNEGLCGAGGKVEYGETAEETAIREAMEEFNIVPLNLTPLEGYKAENSAYFDSQLYFTDKFVGIPTINKNEFIGQAEWFTLEELQEKRLFPPFKDSLNKLKQYLQKFLTPLDYKNTINSVDGGPGSGRYPKGSGESNELSVSASGTNEFLVKGFKNKQALNNHWKNGRAHKDEYAVDNITTAKQYEQRAVELLESPCSKKIKGYKLKDGTICRYDSEKNDYAKGRPDRGVHTMFKPKNGEDYYYQQLKKEGGEEND